MRRQFRCECCAFTQLTLHSDTAFHQLDKLVTDGQPQAGATILTRDRSIGLSKFFEKVVPLLRGNTNAGVGYLKANPVLSVLKFPVNVQSDRAVISKLAGVAEQVEQYLPDFCYIRAHGSDLVSHAYPQCIFVLLNRRPKSRNDLVNHEPDFNAF